MQDWLQAQIANGFSGFPGLAISGTIPVKEDLINELLAEFLRTAGPRTGPEKPGGVDVTGLLKLVKKAEIHAEPGVVILTFDVRS